MLQPSAYESQSLIDLISGRQRLFLQAEEYAKGAYLYQSGEPADYVYVVLKGRVKLRRQGNGLGRSIIFRIACANEIFGVLDFFNRSEKRRSEAVVMDKATRLLPIRISSFMTILEENWRLQLALSKTFVRLQNDLQFTYYNLQTRDTYKKVLRALKRLAKQYGVSTENGTLVTAFTHQELSEVIGVSRQSVTSAMNKLQRDGLIQYRRQWILIKIPKEDL